MTTLAMQRSTAPALSIKPASRLSRGGVGVKGGCCGFSREGEQKTIKSTFFLLVDELIDSW